MTNEVAVQQLQFIPECLNKFFVVDSLYSYFENTDEGLMPSLHNITWDVIDPVGLQAASYHATEGRQIDVYADLLSTMHGEELVNNYQALINKYFDATFDDVWRLVRRYNLSYCFLDDPRHIRHNMQHYGVEVW